MGAKVLAGTRGSEIVELEGKNGQVLIRGHYDEELWGMCVHNKSPIFFTCGDEGMIASWDLKNHKQIKVNILNFFCFNSFILSLSSHLTVVFQQEPAIYPQTATIWPWVQKQGLFCFWIQGLWP